jgi:hypothetical protein
MNEQLKFLAGPDAPHSPAPFRQPPCAPAFGEQGMANGTARNPIDVNYLATG